MHWNLKVSGYGKIKNAEIEIAPLTLFVGDNNSGKSYLMSLLWGIRNFGMAALLHIENEQVGDEEKVLMDWLRHQAAAAWEGDVHVVGVGEVADTLQAVMDKGLKRNKNDLARKIFNSTNVKIKELQIELKDLDKVSISFEVLKDQMRRPKGISIKNSNGDGCRLFYPDGKLPDFDWFMVEVLFSLIMGIAIDSEHINNDIYLPAARTGFMLTKDIVNKVGRNAVFNIGMEQEDVSPFVRPINQFLDVVNDLSLDGRGDERFGKITDYLEKDMAEGSVEMSNLPNREVLYMPEGARSGIPLRIVSAVVTELSPLILILKHKKYLSTLFYEEPEMCLHPQLQQKMARVICQLSNAGLRMVITTHSDIILQHVNNMICLEGREDAKGVCGQLGYMTGDLLNAGHVKVYQLKSKSGEKTTVEKLVCGKNGFVIPTFNDALDRIMDEAYLIQE